ncbi:unnamed protein product [Kuraishia capsulata CBS 1993]|uniref:54S ribosomal protein L8 C-terminal domain-containing protein n=1 Tax=Kuraishia capsulata CBS 1993 TaxID=1382522 RepID=W6MFU7_9ASCO|nr:uncharacterized protein KUCA_T00000243001 [Kuraishia capsulata CBS 1993]CDK24283.1 unnamed protein product [Kuraishia capsulata CBS 1993]
MVWGRNAQDVRLTLMNLCSSLIKHESIQTTAAKAKRTQRMIENLITKAKKTDNVEYSLKKCKANLFEHSTTIPKLFNVIAPRYADRQGGYTRILKLENRFGDNAPQVILELVDNGEREMKFWLMAKVVARLELQGLPVNALTQKNVDALLMHRSEEDFRKLVDICKKEFFNEPGSLDNLPRIEEDRPVKSVFHRNFQDYEIVPREAK